MRTKTIMVKDVGMPPHLLTVPVEDLEQVMTNILGEKPCSIAYHVLRGNPAVAIIHRVTEDVTHVNVKTPRGYRIAGPAIFAIYTHDQVFSVGQHEIEQICKQYGWDHAPIAKTLK